MHILHIRIDDAQFREAAKEKDDAALLKMMSNYGMRYELMILLIFIIILVIELELILTVSYCR